jgi:hypothetical protein
MPQKLIKTPALPKNVGPFLAFTAGITYGAFNFAALARTDTGIVVVGIVAATALIVALIARLKGVL